MVKNNIPSTSVKQPEGNVLNTVNPNTKKYNKHSLLHINIQSVLPKIEELLVQLEACDASIDVLCLSEHWLRRDTAEFLNHLQGFNVISFFGRQEQRHGGVCIAVNKTWAATNREDIERLSTENVFECAAAEITQSSALDRLLVVCLYRTPNSNNELFLVHLENLLKHLQREARGKKILVCGDINIDMIKYTKEREDLLCLLDIYGYESHIRSPTRVTQNTATSIDCLITNYNVDENKEVRICELGLSDHYAQIVKLPIKSQKVKDRKINMKRSFNKNNKGEFKKKLKDTDWDNVLIQSAKENVDENFDKFLNVLLHIFEECFPKKPAKNNKAKTKPWLTIGIKTSILKKRELSEEIKWNKNTTFISYFKKYKKRLKKVIHEAKRSHNNNRIAKSENKSKTVWEIVRKETGKEQKRAEIKTIIIDNIEKTNKKDIAEAFNTYFLNGPSEMAPKTSTEKALQLLKKTQRNVQQSIYLTPTSTEQVQKAIAKLRHKNSSGWDEISATLLKFCTNEIAYPLTLLINNSLIHGTFPSKLKIAIVKPIYKKDKITSVENYRPIALVPVISKVYEIIVLDRLALFMSKHNILRPEQYGFRKGKSTTTAIYDFTKDAMEALDGSQRALGVFCDLSKAFDCVDHDLLLEKLERYGVRGVPLQWFTTFIKGRLQKVAIRDPLGNTVSSTYKQIKRGVPQGCILSPILFLIYINDLNCPIETARLYLYADDVSILIKDKQDVQLQNKMEASMEDLQEWFMANGLLLNVGKTQMLRFGLRAATQDTTRQMAPLRDGKDMALQTSAKFLGITIDRQFNWKPHVSQLLRRLSSAVFAISTLKHTCSTQTLLIVYRSYFESLLRYGVAFWGSSVLVDSVFKIQKRVIRIIFNLNTRETCKNTFKRNKILTVYSLYIYETLILTYQHKDKLKTTGGFHDKFTRHGDEVLSYPLHRTTLLEKSPMYSGIKIFNNLPQVIRSQPNLKNFKNKLHAFLLTKAYYCTREYYANN